jgi:hypothetical protein
MLLHVHVVFMCARAVSCVRTCALNASLYFICEHVLCVCVLAFFIRTHVSYRFQALFLEQIIFIKPVSKFYRLSYETVITIIIIIMAVRCGLVFWGGNINCEYFKTYGKCFDPRSVRSDMRRVRKEGFVICTGHLMLLGP